MRDRADYSIAIIAADAPPRAKLSNYPEPFASWMAKRDKRPLGDLFGLTNFGVNLTRLAPGGSSALRHAHVRQDEFVYVLEGSPTLITDGGRTPMSPGMCAGVQGRDGQCPPPRQRDGYAKIRDYLETKITNWVGISGIFNITPQDHTGIGKESLVLVEIKGGTWVYIDPKDYANVP